MGARCTSKPLGHTHDNSIRLGALRDVAGVRRGDDPGLLKKALLDARGELWAAGHARVCFAAGWRGFSEAQEPFADDPPPAYARGWARFAKHVREVYFRSCVKGLALIGVAALLLVPSTATAGLRLLSLTSPVEVGNYAKLTIAVKPTTVLCSIVATHNSVESQAKGLIRQRPRAGRVTWRWRTELNEPSGAWQIVVDCGQAGKLRTSLFVKGSCLSNVGDKNRRQVQQSARRDTACV